MIRIHIPGFDDSDGGGPRWGDAQIIDDGTNYEIIDGYCGAGTDHLISALKRRNINRPYLHISHAHYDHYYGIRKIINDSYFKPRRLYLYNPDTLNGDFAGSIRSEISTMKAIIKEAKAKGIPVTYLNNGDRIVHGEIKINVYRSQPKTYDGNSDGYINDGSLAYFFPDLGYLTTGDGPTKVNDSVKPVLVKIGHHGNYCVRTMATWLYKNGCRYCWDNDYSTRITDFLQTGREDCLGVGMKYFSCHGDINIIYQNGAGVIYKDSSHTTYKCAYKGKAVLKQPTLAVVMDVLRGIYGSQNTRITRLINAGYYPSATQDKINELIKLVKG